MNQPEIEWNPLPTLHGGSGGHYEVASLIAPKTVTMWAQTLLHRRVMVQGSRVLVIGRRLQVLVVDGVLALAPSTLHFVCDLGSTQSRSAI